MTSFLGSILFVLVLLGLSQARIAQESTSDVNHPGLIHHINHVLKPSWVARPSRRFSTHSLTDAERLCGFKPLPREAQPPVTVVRGGALEDPIPEYFDPREQWGYCADLIGHIRDQSNCGSCWAFASTGAFNDRLCVATQGNFTDLLSVQETASCCGWSRGCLMCQGCNGGNPLVAWIYFRFQGLVTGGDYSDVGKGTSCYPYEIPPCHGGKNCSGVVSTPKCQASTCTEKDYSTPWAKDIHKASSFYSVEAKVETIQRQLMTKGPLSVAMKVYSDFMVYSSGVYHHVTGDVLGGHAVKLIGWGVDKDDSGKDLPYWLVANSWGPTWGLQGLFKIARGSDECGIETTMVVGGDVNAK